MNQNDKPQYGFTTTILHGDRQKPIEHGSLHKPIHTSVAFGYKDARELAAVFQGRQPGYRYGRQGNPTVSALEDKITRMEDGYATICFSTGMAAIGAVAQALLREGDHVVSSAFLFGNTNSLWQTVGAQGVSVSMVDATDVANVE
ncbi:MAG TPA: PLP-dependent transferase, partial [Noviherbaspirillum sp.]